MRGAPLTAVGILRPESQRTSDDDAFYFKVDIPKMLSIMSFRDAEAYVAGINDLLRGNPEQGILPAEEKIARGRVAIDELARFRDARQSGDQETVDQITRKFDPSTPEGREFPANTSPTSATATSSRPSSSCPTFRCSSTRSA